MYWKILTFLSSQIFHKMAKIMLIHRSSLVALKEWSISCKLIHFRESLGATMDHWKASNTSAHLVAMKEQLIKKRWLCDSLSFLHKQHHEGEILGHRFGSLSMVLRQEWESSQMSNLILFNQESIQILISRWPCCSKQRIKRFRRKGATVF